MDLSEYTIQELRVMRDEIKAEIFHRFKPGGDRAGHPLFQIWRGMIGRCSNPKIAYYEIYGGRGISVCPEWVNDFWKFVEDVGERPDGYSLDRVDNDGNYEPGNVKWSTAKEQARNSRQTPLTAELVKELRAEHIPGRGGNRKELARKYNVTPWTIDNIAYGRTWVD